MALCGNLIKNIFLLVFIVLCFHCQSDKKEQNSASIPSPSPEKPVASPPFSADSVYAFIQQQIDFGARVPGTDAHRQCRIFLQHKLSSYGFTTSIQEGKATTFNNTSFVLYNILARYKPELTQRLLLCAHYDTRPFADKDLSRQNEPIDGANDGASGVAVILEIARQIQLLQPDIGIDIVFFDLEDYGQPEKTMFPQKEDTWCLGSQYFTKNIPWPSYSPIAGILLDMVGAQDAVFPKEGTSMHYAAEIVNEVWTLAARLGHTAYFVNETTPMITDDHLYLNKAGIRTIDIIHIHPYTYEFGSFHHTHQDNLSIISKKPLQAVGETILAYILQKKA